MRIFMLGNKKQLVFRIGFRVSLSVNNTQNENNLDSFNDLYKLRVYNNK